MAKQIKDTNTRKYDLKDCFFDGDKLMVSEKDAEPIAVDLIADLKQFFLNNTFNVSVQMKSETEIEDEQSEE